MLSSHFVTYISKAIMRINTLGPTIWKRSSFSHRTRFHKFAVYAKHNEEIIGYLKKRTFARFAKNIFYFLRSNFIAKIS